MAASIQSLLEEISGIEDPIEELQSLKTALFSIPVGALRDSVSRHRFDVVFSLLNSNDRLVKVGASGLLWKSNWCRLTAESVSALLRRVSC